MNIMNFISLVSAHTGNDSINHIMGWFDWVLTVVMVIAGIFIARRVIKGKKRKENKT